MNTKRNTIKLITTYIMGFVMLMLATLGVLKFKNKENDVYAKGVNKIDVSITNANFDKDSVTSYPDESFSGFTAYNGNSKKTNSNNDVNITAGVIDLNVDEWGNKFSYAKNKAWNKTSSKLLMIDSTVEKDGVVTKHNANYGYRTNDPIKMDAGSKYMITTYVSTATDAKIASLYLYDDKGDVVSSIQGINAYNDFVPYTFFISTNETESLNLTLGLYLEGAGTVLFDNIYAQKLNTSEYNFLKSSTPESTRTEKDFVDNIVENYVVNNNGEFVNANDSSIKTNFKAEVFDPKASTISPVSVDNADGTNTKAIYLKNNDKTYAQYQTINNFLAFNPNTIYKVSIGVKTNELEGTAFLQLVRTDIDENDYEKNNYSADLNKTIKITSNTVSETESLTNDYKTYSFLINSHPSEVTSYKLMLGLGLDSSTLTSGEMYVSNIKVSKINYSTYNSTSTDSEKIDLVKAYSYEDSKIYLKNGQFDAFKIDDYNNPMPATPISWNVTTGKNTQKYGVVNTSSNEFAKLTGLSNIRNPYSDEVNNNVLMMYNETSDTLIYKSDTKNLDAKSYHKFEIDVQTQNAPLKLSLITTKDEKEVELSSVVVDTEYDWKTVTLFLYTGYQSVDVSLKLTLETSNYGYAYIDATKFDYPSKDYANVEEEFKATVNSTYTDVTDLTNILKSNSSENYAETNYFTGSQDVQITDAGIITLNSTHLDEVINDLNNIEIFNSVAGNNVLGISSEKEVYYTMKSNIGYKLTTGEDKFYKLSVSVYTQLDSNNAGATIKLTGFEDAFEKITSNNAWSTYTFYITASSDITTYLELSLGDKNDGAIGEVFFGNIIFEDDITADEYNSAKVSASTKIVTNTTTEKEDTEDTEKDTSSTKNKTDNKLWLYLIPSILTAAAIIIAVVGIAVRKIKWKKPTKKTKNSYDRNKTVSIQYYNRKATTMREEKIRELNADLEKISAQRKVYEDEYKQDLTKLREMKIKRANPVEIAKLEKDMKKNQKLSASLGVTANKITNELEYTKTDSYLNSLIKKLQREPSSNDNPENNK